MLILVLNQRKVRVCFLPIFVPKIRRHQPALFIHNNVTQHLKKNYSIHNKQLIIHLFDNLKIIIGMMIIVPIYARFRYGNDFVIDQTLILIFIGTILFMNIPALILFINYHSNNKNIEFTLDQN